MLGSRKSVDDSVGEAPSMKSPKLSWGSLCAMVILPGDEYMVHIPSDVISNICSPEYA